MSVCSACVVGVGVEEKEHNSVLIIYMVTR